MARSRTSQLSLGVILAAVGAVLLATRFAPIETAPAWLLGLGLAFALLAIFQRSFGWLIAGMVLLGLGAGMVLGDRAALGLSIRAWRLVALGAAFVLVWALAAVLQLKAHWWPLPVGLVLVGLGAAPFLRHLFFVPPSVEVALRTWWPAALVVAGAAFIFTALRK